jgi:hypothetical protein
MSTKTPLPMSSTSPSSSSVLCYRSVVPSSWVVPCTRPGCSPLDEVIAATLDPVASVAAGQVVDGSDQTVEGVARRSSSHRMAGVAAIPCTMTDSTMVNATTPHSSSPSEVYSLLRA